ECYEQATLAINKTTKVPVVLHKADGNNETVIVDFKRPWPKKTTAQIIKEVCGIDILSMDVAQLQAFLRENKIETAQTWGSCVMAIFDELVEHTIIQPTHVIDRPVESTPLC